MNENTCKKIGFVVETLCRQFPEDGDQTGRRSTTRHCKPSLHTKFTHHGEDNLQ